MRKVSTGWTLLAGLLLVVGFAGCEGDQGPAGPAGTVVCMNCHTDQFDDELATFLKPIQTQFSFSKHGMGDTFERNSVPCSRCHTSEGFQHFVNTSDTIPVEGSQIHCFTCHAPHTNENFTVRVTGPVTIDVGGTYNKNESNVCVVCHQARVPNPPIEGGATLTSRQRRWGPHHGPQSLLLTAQGFYSFDGSGFSGTHAHNTIANGCVNCHMAEPLGPLVGGHSFWLREEGDDEININGCYCHDGDFTDGAGGYEYIVEWRTEFHEKFDALTADMAALGWIDPDASNGFTNPGTYTEQQLGAIWNWLILEEDLSEGVHNPSAAMSVVEATQAFVDTQGGASSLANNDNMKSR